MTWAATTHDEKMHKCIILLANQRFFYIIIVSTQLPTKTPQVNNHNDLFMHFLITSRSGQVASDGCNGQVFLLVRMGHTKRDI